MTRLRPILPLVASLVLAGCASAADSTPSAEPSAEEIPTSEASLEPSTAPSEEPTPTEEPSEAPSATPAETPPPTGGGFQVAANAEADGLFLARDACENRRDGYQLEYPDEWYTNTEYRDFPPCVWFSPTSYETDGDEVPAEIAIIIEWVASDVGSFEQELSREEGEVGGQAAVRTEHAGAAGNGGMMPPEWRSYRYVIQLGRTSEEGPNLIVTTTNEMGGDYELNKAVLDRIMTTIEFIGSTQ